jgi:hypothetical protein
VEKTTTATKPTNNNSITPKFLTHAVMQVTYSLKHKLPVSTVSFGKLVSDQKLIFIL